MLARHLTAALAFSVAVLSVGGLSAPAHADSNCSDAAACLASFDDGNPGDNQGGDSGADREDRSSQRDK